MSPIKTILVHLDTSPRSAQRLQVARQLALQHEAGVKGLYAVSSAFVEMPFALTESASAGELVLKLDAERRERARREFDRAVASPGPAVSWHELGMAPAIWGFTQQALCADLLVLGQHQAGSSAAHDVPADFVEAVVLASGKPALLLPYAGDFERLGNKVLVAWNSSRESAHALSAAMPMLQLAAQVDLVAWGPEHNAREASAERALIEQYLSAHGVHATLHWYGRPAGDAGEDLLSLAAELSSDLLVMGCYGHSRARELVLGGATRTVLQAMTLPVLMAH